MIETSKNASSRKLKNWKWLCQPLVHTVMARTRALQALVLPITIWTVVGNTHFQFFNFLEEAFLEISLITGLKQFSKSVHWDFIVILRKQKTPGAIHNLNQSIIWISLGVFCFPWGKQKTPGGVSPGVFCFPRITLKSESTDITNCS